MKSKATIIKELREEKGISQVELSKKIGVSSSTIAMIESGAREGSLKNLKKIADYFGVTALLFFDSQNFPGWNFS